MQGCVRPVEARHEAESAELQQQSAVDVCVLVSEFERGSRIEVVVATTAAAAAAEGEFHRAVVATMATAAVVWWAARRK